MDALAFIGKNLGEENVYIATGDSGHGMTHGTIAGMLLTDLICGRENAWAKLYDPSRKPTRSLGAFARENLNVVKQYADYVSMSVKLRRVKRVPLRFRSSQRAGFLALEKT